MFSTTLALFAILVGATDSAPQIQISSEKTTLVIGEPLRMSAKWTTSAELRLMTDYAEVEVDRGSGYYIWREASGVVMPSMPRVITLPPVQPWFTTHIVGVTLGTDVGSASLGVLAFPAEGIYRVRLRYGTGTNVVNSNAIAVTVNRPTGANAQLLDRHLRSWSLLVSDLAGQFEERLESLFDDYPLDPYLARSFVILMEKKIERAMAEAPDGYPVQGEVPALLERLDSAQFGNSPFDEDRLAVLSDSLSRSGRRTEAIAVARRILERYPNGAAAYRAQWLISQPPRP